MAATIASVVNDGGTYFCEAPVGIGKSYAYLVPSMLAGKRVLVATAKKALQDQLVDKDIPYIRRVMRDAASGGHVPLKGKSNYSCRAAGLRVLEKSGEYEGPYLNFLSESRYGDRIDYPGIVPKWWGNATAEDCIGKRCEHHEICGFMALKREAATAKIVVTNHHVLGAEMFYGYGKLVGGPYDVLVVDEAHALDDGIRSAFTSRITRDSITRLRDLCDTTGHSLSALRQLTQTWERMFDDVGELSEGALEHPVFNEAMAGEAMKLLMDAQKDVSRITGLYGDSNESSDEEDYFEGEGIEGVEIDALGESETANRDAAIAGLNQVKRMVDTLSRGLTAAQGKGTSADNIVVFARHDERGKPGIDCAPVNVGGIARQYLAQIKSVILCSATLAVDGKFDGLEEITGVKPTVAHVLPSVFDYSRQGFVYIPKDLPGVSRSHEDYVAVMRDRVRRAGDLVEASGGGAFILTTANDELAQFATAMRHRFPGRTFVQGRDWDGDPATVLAKFRACENSVLVGSKSFWEGVDVQGEALRLVILTKLPFPRMGDPIVEARKERAGSNGFNAVFVGDMLTELRQGVGRLIRSKTDKGGIAILDSRVWEKGYGKAVIRSLPWSQTQVTTDLSTAARNLQLISNYYARGRAAANGV